MLQNTSPQRRSLDSTSVFGSTINLQWVPFTGFVPKYRVSIWNSYESRTDYVCKVKCEPGFYNPSKGSRCYYAYGGKEYYSYSFDFLVNWDNFELLEWVPGSYGSYPALAVKVCEGYDVLVGKNKYGLGKVVPKQSSFYLPWEGYQYAYYYYDVLSINKGSYSQEVTNVMYDTNKAKVLELPFEMLKMSSLDNYECQSVKRTVTLKGTSLNKYECLSINNIFTHDLTTDENHWDIQRSKMYGKSIIFSAGIPEFHSGSVSVSIETQFRTTLGKPLNISDHYKVSVEMIVDPSHSCKVKILEKKVTASIPFTARLSRFYSSGNRASTSIVGQYHGMQAENLKAVVEKCEQIPNAQPCPSEGSG
ncbi:NATT3 protein, partial [Polypterus senegalus]